MVTFVWIMMVCLAAFIWLDAWIAGKWLASLLFALFLAAMWLFLPSPGNYPTMPATLVCLFLPWLPMIIRAAFKRITADVTLIARDSAK